MKRPIESDYISFVAYTRALEQYCDEAEKQEPVGYFSVNDYGNWEENENGYGNPLYTHPPKREQEPVKIVEYICVCGKGMRFESVNGVVAPKREWVGLTDEEIAEAVGAEIDGVYLRDFRAIEAKLKEKNT